jgi:hypothetical protein
VIHNFRSYLLDEVKAWLNLPWAEKLKERCYLDPRRGFQGLRNDFPPGLLRLFPDGAIDRVGHCLQVLAGCLVACRTALFVCELEPVP